MFVLRKSATDLIKIKEDNNFIYVSFPYHPELVKKAKSIFPHKFLKTHKCWVYPALLREEVYETFGLYCPPKNNKANFNIDEPLLPVFFKYQIECIKLAREYPKFGFYLEMGLGKSLIAATILKYKKCKSLIVAPLSTLRTVWVEHFKKFYPNLKVYDLYPFSKRQRINIIKYDDGIHIINYDGFKIHYEDIINAGYKCLVIDESSKLKGRTTQIAKKLIKMAQQTESVYLLSGNPAPNSKLEFYAQVEALAPGLLGWNFYQFKNRYFVPKEKWEWVEKKETKQEFVNRLKKIAIFIKKADVLELPEKVFIEREVEMSEEQWKCYNELRNELRTQIQTQEKKVDVLVPNVLQQIMKLRQITSGFLYYQEIVDEIFSFRQKKKKTKFVKKAVTFADSKLKVLKEVLEEIPKSEQVLIWGIFEEEIKLLQKELESACAIYGGIAEDERNKILKDFINGKFKYLIAHPATLGHGITLTNCSYAIYYSLDWSAELWSQSQDRIHRIGQKKSCTYISLLCKDTIDEIIYARLQKKIEGTQEILEHLKIEIK